jgi:hypothetical protein
MLMTLPPKPPLPPQLRLAPDWLPRVAALMRNLILAGDGANHYTAPDGTEILFGRAGQEWTLELRRDDRLLGPEDLLVYRQAFNVPPGTDGRILTTPGRHPKSGRPLVWRRVVYQWLELRADDGGKEVAGDAGIG